MIMKKILYSSIYNKYLQDIISINSNKNLQRINVHHDHRGGYFLIDRLSEKSVAIIGI